MHCRPNSSPDDLKSLEISKRIDNILAKERIKNLNEKVVKLLILGPSGSGKSTVLRQFRFDKGVDYSEEDR
jgi:ABC-type phosphate transport system ATPase subunit